jgi:hypothetical protein
MWQYLAMKVLRILILTAAVAGLASCGASSTSDTADTSTTVTTVAAPDCSKAAIELGVGEPTSYFECSGEWAGIMPASYADDCNECESVWLYKWEAGAWNLKGVGNQYSTLTPNSVAGMTGLLKNKIYTDTMTEFPPKEVACELWPTNRYPENVAETGCTPDPAN